MSADAFEQCFTETSADEALRQLGPAEQERLLDETANREFIAGLERLLHLPPVSGVPRKPYEPGGLELFAPLRPRYEAGDYAEAADRGRELLAGDPPYADLFYNVACCESLAGQKDEAIAHLRRAIELSERPRPFLEGDSDLDPIRQDPVFKKLLAS